MPDLRPHGMVGIVILGGTSYPVRSWYLVIKTINAPLIFASGRAHRRLRLQCASVYPLQLPGCQHHYLNRMTRVQQELGTPIAGPEPWAEEEYC